MLCRDRWSQRWGEKSGILILSLCLTCFTLIPVALCRPGRGEGGRGGGLALRCCGGGCHMRSHLMSTWSGKDFDSALWIPGLTL